MKHACQYAIVHFMPFVETREFANVGIVLLSPEHRYFGYRLLNRYGRVTKFFDQLEPRIYLQAKKVLIEELGRVRSLLKGKPLDGRRKQADTTLAKHIFAELIRPREVMFRFDTVRAVLTDDPEVTLHQLYQFYVEREFATKEYQERLLEREMRRLLYGVKLGDQYRNLKVGDSDFHVRFPFVHTHEEKPVKIIKPLHLAHDEPSKILTHGGPWVDKIRRLRKRRLLPEKVLFAVQGPGQQQENRFAAFEEICSDLRAEGIVIASTASSDQIANFAATPV